MKQTALYLIACVLLLLLGRGVAQSPGVPLQPKNYADISGSNGTVQLASGGGCNQIQLLNDSASSHVIRYGDSSTSATSGGTIAAGGGQFISAPGQSYYPLASEYVYVQTGDTARFICWH